MLYGLSDVYYLPHSIQKDQYLQSEDQQHLQQQELQQQGQCP